MLTNQQWSDWKSKWNWILAIAKNRGWEFSKLKIKKPESKKAIEKTIAKYNLILPKDFLFVVENYSSGVLFDYSIEGEEPENELEGIFSGGSGDGLWDFQAINEFNKNIQSWQECFSNPENDYDKVWYNKTALQVVPNGDVIAFDIKENSDIFPVVYLSHDGDEFHGKKLADNFIDFITTWSNLGCPGNEDWQLSPFVEEKGLSSSCKTARLWIDWLEKK